MKQLFAFPNPVNEYAARSTAGIIVVLSVVTLVLGLTAGWGWLLWLIALGFWLRVAGGPRYSPAGRLAVHVIAPRLGAPRLVPGPPKRFAQTIGAVLSTAAAIFWTVGLAPVAWVLLGLPDRGGVPRILRRVLPGLLDLRQAPERRCHPGERLRGLQQHLSATGLSPSLPPRSARRDPNAGRAPS